MLLTVWQLILLLLQDRYFIYKYSFSYIASVTQWESFEQSRLHFFFLIHFNTYIAAGSTEMKKKKKRLICKSIDSGEVI